ncbi:MAG: phosphoenolpyruvate carboxylase, partial [Phycisphaerales bacterium]|nr:phosphoenolpyruvate carboxylase [Phycisphaerales bacterium]
MASDARLQAEIDSLRTLLGDVLECVDGEVLRRRLEEAEGLARDRRAGDPDAHAKLEALVASLTPNEMLQMARGFSIAFDLVNLAEDRQRVRVLRQRERDSAPHPRSESIAAAIATLRDRGFDDVALRRLLDRIEIELVFTAHPTEAKRRSVREKVRDLRQHLATLDDPRLLDRERTRLERLVRGDLLALWQTDLMRNRRPTVLEEVARAMYFARTL